MSRTNACSTSFCLFRTVRFFYLLAVIALHWLFVLSAILLVGPFASAQTLPGVHLGEAPVNLTQISLGGGVVETTGGIQAITWDTPFPDTNYQAVCTVIAAQTDAINSEIPMLVQLNTKSTTGMTILVSMILYDTPVGMMVDCIGVEPGASDVLHSGTLNFTDPELGGLPAPATLTWDTPFPDTNYAAVCTPSVNSLNSDATFAFVIQKNPSSMEVGMEFTTGGYTSITGYVDCIGAEVGNPSDVQTGSLILANNQTANVPWNSLFPDANYIAACGTANDPDNPTGQFTAVVNSKQINSVTATLRARQGSGSVETDCFAILTDYSGGSGGGGSKVTLTTSLNPSVVGQAVTFTARLSAAAGSDVSFLDGTTLLGTSASNGQIATYSTSGLTVGSHAITASYIPQGSSTAVVSNVVMQVVNAASPAFSTTAANDGNITIASGSTGTMPLTLTATGGYTGVVNLACAPSSPAFTCSISPTSVTFTASGATTQSATLSIVTGATTGDLTLPAKPFQGSSSIPIYSAMALWLPGSFLAYFGLRRRRYGKHTRRFLLLLLLCAGLASAAGLMGCGTIQKDINCAEGNSSCSNNTTNTPAGNYTVAVTSSDGTTKNTITVNVTVQ